MVTVDDAIRAGKTRLEVRCGTCRVLHHVPWQLLKGVVGPTRLAGITAKLTCRTCGARPDPKAVRPIGPDDLPPVPRG